MYPRKPVNGECVSITPISTSTALKTPSLFRASTKSWTPWLAASCYASADQDKTAFITPHGIYSYNTMTFSLKNAGATYQKTIQKCLESQLHKNVEAYVDDVVVKTKVVENFIADLAETFANLRAYR